MRQANKYDKTEIIEMMLQFCRESGIESLQQVDNESYWHKLLDSILAGQGIIFLEPGVGLIMGMITHSVWCDRTFGLHELAWWVKPEHRGGTVGYKLLKAYLAYGEELQRQGRIQFMVMSRLNNSPVLNYGRFGFKRIDENWMR